MEIIFSLSLSGVQVALESSQEQEGEIEQEVECGEPVISLFY